MTKRVPLSRVGRGLLLSVAVGSLPLAGCTDIPDSLKWRTVDYSASEKALYDQAIASSDPATVSRFLSSYPRSSLIRPLLVSLSPAELQRVSPSAVNQVDPNILASLPPKIRLQLGIVGTPTRASEAADNGY